MRKLLMVALLALAIPAHATAKGPAETVEYTVDGLIALLQTYPGDMPVLIELDDRMTRAVSGVTPATVINACAPTYYYIVGGGVPALVIR